MVWSLMTEKALCTSKPVGYSDKMNLEQAYKAGTLDEILRTIVWMIR